VRSFDRDQLLDAFDAIAEAAIAADTRLDIAVYRGSALLLASNFRFATEDVDIARLSEPWPDWLAGTVRAIAQRNGWSDTWLNDAVTSHLSTAVEAADHLVRWGTFPRRLDQVGLTVFVPTAEYLFALKLKASRVSDFARGAQDLADTRNLMRIVNITDVEQAMTLLARYFPNSAKQADKERFVVKYLLRQEAFADAPRYPQRDL
jgi:hypothetical protein